MKPDTFKWLEDWLTSQADGEWEHRYGIRIESLDNPGWSVMIDIGKASSPSRSFEPVIVERSESDWLQCRVVDGRFEGFGDTRKLAEIIEIFREWTSR